ncbi:MAG: NUDIX hydrolase [Chlamydiales bacterium]|nr:NUDIX hydrolase [Chlamydiales bacterium]
MYRRQLLDLLHTYHPTYPEEIESKRNMLHFIEDNARCFERALEIGHMTASSWLLSQDGSQALLMHHRKLNRWLQLGGHADGDSNLLEVAIKEAQEESGIHHIEAITPHIFDIDIHLIPENPKEKAHYHYDVRFLLQVKSLERVQGNHESKELLWISKDPSELPTKENSILRMFTKWTKSNDTAPGQML